MAEALESPSAAGDLRERCRLRSFRSGRDLRLRRLHSKGFRDRANRDAQLKTAARERRGDQPGEPIRSSIMMAADPARYVTGESRDRRGAQRAASGQEDKRMRMGIQGAATTKTMRMTTKKKERQGRGDEDDEDEAKTTMTKTTMTKIPSKYAAAVILSAARIAFMTYLAKPKLHHPTLPRTRSATPAAIIEGQVSDAVRRLRHDSIRGGCTGFLELDTAAQGRQALGIGCSSRPGLFPRNSPAINTVHGECPVSDGGPSPTAT